MSAYTSSNDTYEFDHRCPEMPENSGRNRVAFFRKEYGQDSVFSASNTRLYGFKYCPYCGEKLDNSSKFKMIMDRIKRFILDFVWDFTYNPSLIHIVIMAIIMFWIISLFF